MLCGLTICWDSRRDRHHSWDNHIRILEVLNEAENLLLFLELSLLCYQDGLESLFLNVEIRRTRCWGLRGRAINDVLVSWKRALSVLDVFLEERNLNFKIKRSVSAEAVFTLQSLFHGDRCKDSSLLYFLNDKDFVLMELLVHWELTSLSESFGASLIWALERLLSSVNVSVFFKVLCKSKLFITYHTDELFSWLMSSDVSS